MEKRQGKKEGEEAANCQKESPFPKSQSSLCQIVKCTCNEADGRRKIQEGGLTSEEMILQAALGHELVDEQQLPILHAVAQQLHQVGMRQPPEKVHLRLQAIPPARQRQGLDQHESRIAGKKKKQQRERAVPCRPAGRRPRHQNGHPRSHPNPPSAPAQGKRAQRLDRV